MKLYETALEVNIRKVLHAELDGCPESGRDEVWERLQKSLQQGVAQPAPQSAPRKWVFRLAAVAAAVIVVASVASFFAPKQVTAVGKLLSGRVQRVTGQGFINDISFSKQATGQPEQGRPQDSGIGNVSETFNSLKEAIRSSPFPLIVPNYIPDQFSFHQGAVEPSGSQARVLLAFTNKDDPKDRLIIRETGIWTEVSYGMVYSQDGTLVKEAIIDGNKVTVLSYNGRMMEAFWMDQGTAVKITGNLTEEEMLKIVEQMNR